MKKVIKGNCVFFYNELEEELMYLDHSTDECIWFFNSEKTIKITKDINIIKAYMQIVTKSFDDFFIIFKKHTS